jgi:hypothetical protein
MSINRLCTIAVQRDKTAPRRAIKKPKNAEEVQQTQKQDFVDLLVSAIPTEPLALYTFMVGAIVGTIDPGDDEWLGVRWAIYGATIAFIVLWIFFSYRRRTSKSRKRKLPLAEIASAAVAFATWGLVMPESPLSAELSGDAWIVWTTLITGVGAAALLLLTGSLKKEVK